MNKNLEKAKEAALRLLEKQAMSSARVLEKLSSRGYSSEVCAEVLFDLTRAGLIHDAQMARDLVDRLIENEPAWRDWLLAKLATRSINEADATRVVDEILADLDETACAVQAGIKRLGTLPEGLEVRVKARRLSGYLSRRGFSQEAVTQTVRQTLGLMTDE